MEKEINKKQLKEDLIFVANKLKEIIKPIEEAYIRISKTYESIK